MARENHRTRRQTVGLLVKLNPPDKMKRRARPHISADPPLGLTYCAAGAYRRKALFGTCAFRKRRTRLIVRCFNSSGSFHGNTVISAFGASEATSIEVCSG